MHAYIKRALVFAALVAAGFVLLAAEAPTEQHVALSRDRRAFALGVAYWEITADVATSFMPLPVGIPLGAQRSMDVYRFRSSYALNDCVPRAQSDACAVSVGCDPSDTKCACEKMDVNLYSCLSNVKIPGNYKCNYTYSPENQPVYEYRRSFLSYCVENIRNLNLPFPFYNVDYLQTLTATDHKWYDSGLPLSRCLPLIYINACVETTRCANTDRACLCYNSKSFGSCLRSLMAVMDEDSRPISCTRSEEEVLLNNYTTSFNDFCTEKRLATGPRTSTTTSLSTSTVSTSTSTTTTSQPTVTPVATVTFVAKTSSATTGPAVSSLASVSIVAIVALLFL